MNPRPGDEGLLTCEGARLIESADVIVYDYLSNPRLLGRARADARLVYLFIDAVALVMGGARLRHLLLTLAAFLALIAVAFTPAMWWGVQRWMSKKATR